MENKKPEIGIIGFGNFGQLMTKHLAKKADVVVTDVMDKSERTEELGARFVALDEVLKRKIIILAVPMESLVSTLEKIKDKLIPGTLVMDVCSLKMFSCSAMKRILPGNVGIIGTHPLFGPQSAPGSIDGLRIVLCEVRSEKINSVKSFCESFGLKVFMTTPEEHDKQMAVSQALTHFIGTIAKEMDINRTELSTQTFDKIMDVIEIIKNDTPKLFENMQTMNPFARNMRERFVKSAEELNEKLNSINCKGEE
jgi:prephenate dehydrogenase